MMYEKEITKNERELLSLLDELGLSSITVPYQVDGNKLIMQKGDSLPDIEKTPLDIVSLYQQCLSKLYMYHNNFFSLGIYGIFRSENTECNESNYYLYLKNEVNRIINELEKHLMPELVAVYKNALSLFEMEFSSYREYFEEKTSFELLHGDLFAGNILLYNKQYVLIDFEYMRFGPKISEISFLLLWDIISMPQINKRARFLNDEIEKIQKNKIITERECEIIKKVYIPLYIVLICLYVSAGRYRDAEIVKNGVICFCKNYYDMEEQ